MSYLFFLILYVVGALVAAYVSYLVYRAYGLDSRLSQIVFYAGIAVWLVVVVCVIAWFTEHRQKLADERKYHECVRWTMDRYFEVPDEERKKEHTLWNMIAKCGM